MMQDCIFCKIVEGSLPAYKVYEDSEFLAFLDIRPRNTGHILVIPKKHVQTIFEISEEDIAELYKTVRKISIAAKKAVDADGIIIIQSNIISQGISHFHTHVLPRFFDDGMPIVWESNVEIENEELEKVAEKIRNAVT